jgi:hypothetical protein
MVLITILLVGLIIGTVGWLGDQFHIEPIWFEIVGFVMVIPAGIALKWR